jgi:hypothetical protein
MRGSDRGGIKYGKARESLPSHATRATRLPRPSAWPADSGAPCSRRPANAAARAGGGRGRAGAGREPRKAGSLCRRRVGHLLAGRRARAGLGAGGRGDGAGQEAEEAVKGRVTLREVWYQYQRQELHYSVRTHLYISRDEEKSGGRRQWRGMRSDHGEEGRDSDEQNNFRRSLHIFATAPTHFRLYLSS